MSQLSQWSKFKIGIIAMVLLYILAPSIYDSFLPSEDALIAIYEKELKPIHVESIAGIKLEKKEMVRTKFYVSRYKVLKGEKSELAEILGGKFEANGWKYDKKLRIKSDTYDEVHYIMDKENYQVQLSVTDNELQIHINKKGLYTN